MHEHLFQAYNDSKRKNSSSSAPCKRARADALHEEEEKKFSRMHALSSYLGRLRGDVQGEEGRTTPSILDATTRGQEGAAGGGSDLLKYTGFDRMEMCRQALESIDRQGWKRSFFQKRFHEKFLSATARAFWKLEEPGRFARDHHKILQLNGWDDITQEILISTPRRFGKTIAVSMFAAALIYSAAGITARYAFSVWNGHS